MDQEAVSPHRNGEEELLRLELCVFEVLWWCF